MAHPEPRHLVQKAFIFGHQQAFKGLRLLFVGLFSIRIRHPNICRFIFQIIDSSKLNELKAEAYQQLD